MNEFLIKLCLEIYIKITATPDRLLMSEYAKRFARLNYQEQGELSFRIGAHFAERRAAASI